MSSESPQEIKPLPEVPLKWTDFSWSLEKLRHKPYGKKTRERYVVDTQINTLFYSCGDLYIIFTLILMALQLPHTLKLKTTYANRSSNL